MAEKIQLRRDTAANWASSNPVLSQGEVGIATDTGDIKLGDGSTPWNSKYPWSPNTLNGASKLVSIGDNGWGCPNNLVSTSVVGTGEMTFTVGMAATNITAKWNHYYTDITSFLDVDADPSGSISFNASLKVVSSTNPGTITGTIWRFTFNGRTTATLDPGGTIVADPIGLSVGPGDVVAIRTYLASGTAYPPRKTYGNLSGVLGGFTAASDLTAPGSAAIAGSAGFYYGPAALLGYAAGAGNAKSVLVLGDSIALGANDTAYWTKPALNGTGGYTVRALSGVAGLINIAMGGDSASLFQGFQGTNGKFRRFNNVKYCNSAIIEYGTLDILGGTTAAVTESRNLSIATDLNRLGIAKVFLTTLTPETTSTDGWGTIANQTVWPSESQRLAYNTWVRANCPIDPTTLAPVAVGTSGALLAGSFRHPITGFFDTASRVESSLNPGFWPPADRTVTGSITAGSGALTSAAANFQTPIQEVGGDLGATVSLVGAGAAGAVLTASIASVGSTTAVSLDNLAGTTVTNAQLYIGIKTFNGSHPSPHSYHLISQAINAALL